MIGEDRACDACLARAGLLEALAPLIEVVATKPPNAGVRGLLTLDDDELARALAPGGSEGLRRALDRSPPPAEVLARQRPSEAWSTCRHSSDYPKVLNDLAGQVPAALFGRGDRSRLGTLGERPAVALVGARRASSYGREVGRDLARQLSRAGAAVISGLANGVDAAAHEGALAGAGLTVAVLGCGVDRAYPRRQVGLYERIVEEGLVLSELPCGARPWRWTFPARNRIMAALSMMTVVVEAAERSGSLITAEMAADLQRDVGAVPGPVNAPGHAGANRLLVDGAYVVRSAEDVLDRLFGVGVVRAPVHGPRLAEGAREILGEIERGRSPDTVAATLGLPIAVVASRLAQLELDGYLVADGTGGYQRTSAQPPAPA